MIVTTRTTMQAALMRRVATMRPWLCLNIKTREKIALNTVKTTMPIANTKQIVQT